MLLCHSDLAFRHLRGCFGLDEKLRVLDENKPFHIGFGKLIYL